MAGATIMQRQKLLLLLVCIVGCLVVGIFRVNMSLERLQLRIYRMYIRVGLPTSMDMLEGNALNFSDTCRMWGVTTTIFDPSPAIFQFLHLNNTCLVIVGDVKTNHSSWYTFVQMHQSRGYYLSPDEQRRLPWKSVKLLPWNHFGRKNVGYLFAIQHGAKMIYDFDDDNTLREEGDESLFHKIFEARVGAIPVFERRHHLYNPYPGFLPVGNVHTEPVYVWPRGFPLNFIKDTNTTAVNFNKMVGADKVAVFQSLANNDPDVDAIFRMSRNLPISFQLQDTIRALPHGVYSPWNSQAVIVRDVAFWGLLLPISVSGRVSDIWRSFITTRLLFATPYHICFTSPFVDQYRNPHDYQIDLEDEQDLYMKTNLILKVLSEFVINPSIGLGQNLILIMEALHARNVVGRKDVDLSVAWVQDLSSLKYEWPEISSGYAPFTPPHAPIFDFRRFSLAIERHKTNPELLHSSVELHKTNPKLLHSSVELTSPLHYSRKVPEFYSHVSKLYNMNGTQCQDIRAVVIQGLQRTGLGSNIEAITSAAVQLARYNVLGIFAEEYGSPYMTCPDGSQGHGCVFKRPSPCHMSQFKSDRKCAIKSGVTYIGSHMLACLKTWRLNSLGSGFHFNERKVLAHHLFHLNSRMLSHMTSQRKTWLRPDQKIVSVHIRQGQQAGSWDFVRQKQHVWTSNDISTVLVLLSVVFNTSVLLLVSDDRNTVSTVQTTIQKHRFCSMQLAAQTSHCSHLPPPEVLVTRGSAVNFTSTGQVERDCLRENNIPCNFVKLKEQADAALSDVFLPAFGQGYAGTMKSSYSRMIYSFMNSSNPPVDLDDVKCAVDNTEKTRICKLRWWKDYLRENKSFNKLRMKNTTEQCTCQYDTVVSGHLALCFCLPRIF